MKGAMNAAVYRRGENGYRRRKCFIAAAKAVYRNGETAYRNSENEYRQVGTAYR
jgi:hypothetical protein